MRGGEMVCNNVQRKKGRVGKGRKRRGEKAIEQTTLKEYR